jgi:hypothetical protein
METVDNKRDNNDDNDKDKDKRRWETETETETERWSHARVGDSGSVKGKMKVWSPSSLDSHPHLCMLSTHH